MSDEPKPWNPYRSNGRPTKLTPQLQTKICTMVADGQYVAVVCRAVGICPNTLTDWKRRGEGGEEPFMSFLNALEDAEAVGEARLVEIVRHAAQGPVITKTTKTTKNGDIEVKEVVAPGDARLALDILERVHPTRWGRKDKLDVTATGFIAITDGDKLAQAFAEAQERQREALSDATDG